jgi:hypothetical protein
MMGVAAVIAAFFWAGCAIEEEQPSEEAAEEAGVEEIAEPSPEEIQAEGCPEGQVSNEAGTECMDASEAPKHEPSEEFQRQQAVEQIARYEAEELERNETAHVECQMAKAYLDGGQERVDEIQEPLLERAEQAIQDIKEKGKAEKQEGPTLREAFPNAGYDCTAPEDLPAPPTPAELDKKYEKPADNPKQREVQCGPQSNASPEFREKYC